MRLGGLWWISGLRLSCRLGWRRWSVGCRKGSEWFLPFAAALSVFLGLWPFLDLLVVY